MQCLYLQTLAVACLVLSESRQEGELPIFPQVSFSCDFEAVELVYEISYRTKPLDLIMDDSGVLNCEVEMTVKLIQLLSLLYHADWYTHKIAMGTSLP